MRSFARTLLSGSLFVSFLAVAPPVSAQDIDFGYQWLRLSGKGFGESFALGFGAAYEYPLADPWAVVGFVDLSRRSGSDEDDGVEIDFSETITTFGAAARWNREMMGAFERLFAQVGFGVARSGFTDTISLNGTEIDEFSDSETSPMFTFGAGVTRPFNDLWSLILQGDYRRLFEEGGGANVFRVFVGARRKLAM